MYIILKLGKKILVLGCALSLSSCQTASSAWKTSISKILKMIIEPMPLVHSVAHNSSVDGLELYHKMEKFDSSYAAGESTP